ncbi:sodium-coupled monocarboxylate transporter [Nesidiocoris tenuis]|uniref:Sodium-coupled monocarboxylate transporter n=1 Tax=Nesidiocoris tenuis TaxID=355587 RepID=A0ABN7A8S1_9HEMI|nr:sodium-coupled monocarboxylate transporter [Nesidiocoris tenuis]
MDWFEFLVVIVSLGITLAIGLYFSRTANRSLQEYMLGGRQMSVIPVSLSIAATYLSSSSLVATSQEVYFYGMQVSLIGWFYTMWGLIAAWVHVPVSYSIKSVSSFEYFSRRFNRHVRRFASLTYVVETILHTAISQYVPAITISQAIGQPVFPIACVLALCSLVYTVMGGLKAVTYADSFQAMIVFVCAIILFVVGCWKAGGPLNVYHKSVQGARWEFFNMDPSPEIRYSVPVFIGSTFVLLSPVLLAPSYHQRIAAMPSFDKARKVVILSSLFAGVFLLFTYAMGLIVYAYYAGCDPVLAKKNIKSHNTILSYFVGDISQTVPGIAGFFQAGVIAAGLSTTTSCWNTVACTIFQDLIRPVLFNDREVPTKKAMRILIGIVVLVSIVSTSLVNVIVGLGTSLMEVSSTLKSITGSLTIVLYYSGMFLPWVTCKGAVAGSLTSTVITALIYFGSQHARSNKLVKNLPKILTTAECPINGTTMAAFNLTKSVGTTGYGIETVADPSVPYLFKMTMSFYSLPGVLIGLAVSYLVSWLTGFQDLENLDREMITPIMQWALPKINSNDVKSMQNTQVELTALPGHKKNGVTDDSISKHENRNLLKQELAR